MTRVAHLTTAHPSQDNRIFRKECRALADAGIDVTLVAVHPLDEVIDGIQIRALPKRSGRARRMIRGPIDAWARLREINPEVVHGHDPELIPLLVLFKRLNPRTMVIFDAHEDLPKQVAGKPYLPRALRPVVAWAAHRLERAAGRHLDAIVAATPSISRNYPGATVILVQNFPWLRDFPTVTPPQPGERFRLCYVGGISAGRGADEMISAVRSLGDSAELVLAGPLAPDARKHVDNAPAPVHYLGTVANERISGLIGSCDVGLALLHPLPNYLESQATKIFEYMASGRAFIASDFPAWVAMFEPFGCGLFVDPLDPLAVREAMATLAGDHERVAAMGKAGRDAVVAHYSFEREAERLITFVRSGH